MANQDFNAPAFAFEAGDTTDDSKTRGDAFTHFFRKYFRHSTTAKSTPSSRRSSETSNSASIGSIESSATYLSIETANSSLLETWDADEFIRDFVNEHWSHHADYIKISCNITLSQLHALGRLTQTEGSLACQRLIQVPVIHEELALSLWEKLAEEARNAATAKDDKLEEEAGVRVDTTELSHSKNSEPKTTSWKWKFLNQTKQPEQKEKQPTTITTTRHCPFCSSNCITYSQHEHQEQQLEEEEEEDDTFWQRPEPPQSRNPLWRPPTPFPELEIKTTLHGTVWGLVLGKIVEKAAACSGVFGRTRHHRRLMN
ncbi:hypothetical protein C8A00DRAFT_12090 [Chaetomidium leptoderma]|uniref:Uncharacterized protein n=1 Tax=Chaetomidium leptoderma TaxID=669021 RepID=A0AAN7A1Q6_9PEZI|nr:hypothetical protein C8A00DRAFT_12090 [Chaetomidium leptoderma]